MWPRLGAYFGLPVAEPQAFGMTKMMTTPGELVFGKCADRIPATWHRRLYHSDLQAMQYWVRLIHTSRFAWLPADKEQAWEHLLKKHGLQQHGYNVRVGSSHHILWLLLPCGIVCLPRCMRMLTTSPSR